MITNLLTSSSLILAAIALIYTVWQPEIKQALELKVQLHYDESRKDHDFLKEKLWQRAVPLAMATSIVALLFLPDTLNLLLDTWVNISKNQLINILNDYDANGATLIFVEAFYIALAIHFWSFTKKLYSRHLKFEEKRLE
jgi:hypothetical protein